MLLEELSSSRRPSPRAGSVRWSFGSSSCTCLTLLVILTGRPMEPAGRGLYGLVALITTFLWLLLGPVAISKVVRMARWRAPLKEPSDG
jgi:hypothetical protein